jgi:hypothetical protein
VRAKNDPFLCAIVSDIGEISVRATMLRPIGPQLKEETVMTFVVAGVVLLLALLIGTVFDDEEPNEDDPAVYASSSSNGLAS